MVSQIVTEYVWSISVTPNSPKCRTNGERQRQNGVEVVVLPTASLALLVNLTFADCLAYTAN